MEGGVVSRSSVRPATTCNRVLACTGLVLLPCAATYPQAADSTSTGTIIEQADGDCVPPCRSGYTCVNSVCVERCNPPCPPSQTCGDDGECHVPLPAGSVPYRGDVLQRVGTRQELTQGFTVHTGLAKSEARIRDSVFTFDSSLHLLAPLGDYRVLIRAPGKCVRYKSADIDDPGQVRVVDVRLTPVRLKFGFTWGPYVLSDDYGIALCLDAGAGIVDKHYVGLTFGYALSATGATSYFTDVHDSAFPDSGQSEEGRFMGGGITYGYTGLMIRQTVAIMPRLSLGYWAMDRRMVWFGENAGEFRTNYHTDHDYEPYFVKPGLEVRFGQRLVAFRFSVDTFIGRAFGPTGLNLGLTISLP
jgi:hypothetical protein